MASLADSDIPQWKKDLIARLRSQNKRTASVVERQQQQLYGTTSPPQQQSMSVAVGRAVQQPSLTCLSEPVAAAAVVPVTSRGAVEKCNASSSTCRSNKVKMVQERSWEWTMKPVDDDKMKNGGGGGDDRGGEFNEKSDSDSSEDLQYGPGIVNKLKEKYLNLALREANSRMKPAISMRKAASLENILDDKISEVPISGGNRLYQTRLNGSNDTTKNVPNRYRNTPRGSELKRARSVEAISRAEDDELVITTTKPKRESLHEEMLINNDKRGNDKYTKPTNDNNCKMLEPTPENKPYIPRKNRPKRVVPIMNEREKPPADVVKQHKLIFEKSAENRTKAPQQTGDVAAKVATFTNIISEQKTAKKPPIKTKPIIEKSTTNGVRISKSKSVNQDHKNKESNAEVVRVPKTPPVLPSAIPDISRIDFTTAENERGIKTTSLSETPDLIMTSNPLVATVHSPTFRISATENFIKEEILHSNNANNHSTNNGCASSISPPIIASPKTKPVSPQIPDNDNEETAASVVDGVKRISQQSLININNASNTVTFNFANNSKNTNSTASILSTNKNILNTRTPPSQPLKVEINGVNNSIEIKSPNLITNNIIISPTFKSPSPKINNSTTSSSSSSSKPTVLTTVEIEKNLKNSAKLQEKHKLQQQQQQPSNICVIVKSDNEVTKNIIPKVKKSSQSRGSEPENNSIVFKFTHRKDVPDYVHNEGSNRCVKIEKPKVGEGGIILLPGATIDFTDDDDDEIIMRSLEGPPSPCDVTFINDNILIDGKSSLSQKRKKAKMKITFLEEGPEVFEYPSETSMLTEESPANAQMGHTVPSLTGSSSLANYTPKGTAEEFQPGVTRTNIPISGTAAGGDAASAASEELIQAEEPILFSAGTNSDILF